MKARGRVGVLAHSGIGIAAQEGVIIRRLPSEPNEYASNLYNARCTKLEDAGCSHVLIEDVLTGEVWDAARDRVSRAAG